jgi:Grap2 and cyclin-D-interacting
VGLLWRDGSLPSPPEAQSIFEAFCKMAMHLCMVLSAFTHEAGPSLLNALRRTNRDFVQASVELLKSAGTLAQAGPAPARSGAPQALLQPSAITPAVGMLHQVCDDRVARVPLHDRAAIGQQLSEVARSFRVRHTVQAYEGVCSHAHARHTS